MSYGKIYRGEFANALSNENNETVEQIIRIDISDTSTGNNDLDPVSGTIIIGFNSPAFTLVSETDEQYETYLDFFRNGMAINISGTTSSDGDYIIATEPTFHPPRVSPMTLGYVEFELNRVPTGGDAGLHDVTITNITEAEILPLSMAGDPLHIGVKNDNEDKFDPSLKSKFATIRVHTSNTIGINTFCEGTDRQFFVEVFVDDLIVFRGFLMIPDLQVDFMPDPNELVLSATDNLKALKDITLVNDDGENPQFDHRLIDYIRWCLKSTGIEQPINIINNLKHGTGSFEISSSFASATKTIVVSDTEASKFYAGMPLNISGTASNDGDYTVRAIAIENILGFDFALVFVNETVVDESNVNATFTDSSSALPFHQAVYLDARSWEKEIGLSEDCSTVLNKILGEDSDCFQHQGEWWIRRIDEIEDIAGTFQYKVNKFSMDDGSLISSTTVVREKSIGVSERITFMNDDPVLIPDRALAKAKLTYKFVNPLELVCNVDFQRGDYIEDIPNVTINQDTYNAKKYELDCWINTSAPYTPGQTTPTPTFEAYIKRLFQNGYEKQRFAVLPTNTSNTDFLESLPVKMNSRDKFDVSVDFAWDSNQGGSGVINLTIYFVTLEGNDGTNWYLDKDGKWHSAGSPGTWTVFNGIVYSWDVGDVDETTFRSVSVSADPLPVSGLVRISLNSIGQSSIPDRDMYYNNIQLTYTPFVNGSYQRYTGHYNQVSQNIGYTSTREKEVFISDSFSTLFKGALKIFNGVEYVLTYGFTDAHWLIATPYGKIQAFAEWNQYRKNARNFDGDFDGMESDIVLDTKYDGVDLLHKINLTDADPNTNYYHFLILHYDQDFHLLEMKAYIVSLYRKDIGKSYEDTFEFKYLTE